jgi:hypothetical protein
VRKLRFRLTPAGVIATLALFLALGGGAYAATQLASNSVGSQQIKTGSIRIGDLNKELRIKLNDEQLASGETVRGVFRLDAEFPNPDRNNFQAESSAISFGPGLKASPKVDVIKEGATGNADCAGSPTFPTAAPGFVCFYIQEQQNVGQFEICAIGCPNTRSSSPFGALLTLVADVTHTQAFIEGSWAVTAP